ncbi:23495_t:CDS:2, partial [Gigaspora rosea]
VATDYMTKWPEAKAIEILMPMSQARHYKNDTFYLGYGRETHLPIHPSEIEELLEVTFLQRLFELIEVVPQARASQWKELKMPKK